MQSISIGPIALPNPVLLAPMSGVTDAPFRRQVAEQGAGLVISEMTACAALAEGRRNARRRIEGQGSGQAAGLHVVQLAGCEAHWMAEGARIAEGAGAAIVDINMGCPAKHVTNGASGSALMRDLDHALTLIAAVVQAVRVPVTLKMRLGWDDFSRKAPACASSRCMAARAASSTKAAPTGRRCASSRKPCRSPSSSTATSKASPTPTRRSRLRKPTR
jgi:tRNA-dihydrouridine synthase